MRIFVLSIGLTWAQPPPLWSGMPDTLPLDFLEAKSYSNYGPKHELDIHTPFSQRRALFQVKPEGSEVPLLPEEALKTVSQDHWVHVPDEKWIETEKVGALDHWKYPAGLELVHRFMDSSGRPFLIRIMRHFGQDIWRFGAYELDQSAGRWRLLKSELPELKTVTLDDLKFGKLNVSFEMIPTGQCNSCHTKHTSAPADASVEIKTEPCDFRPGNARIKDKISKLLKTSTRAPAAKKPARSNK